MDPFLESCIASPLGGDPKDRGDGACEAGFPSTSACSAEISMHHLVIKSPRCGTTSGANGAFPVYYARANASPEQWAFKPRIPDWQLPCILQPLVGHAIARVIHLGERICRYLYPRCGRMACCLAGNCEGQCSHAFSDKVLQWSVGEMTLEDRKSSQGSSTSRMVGGNSRISFQLLRGGCSRCPKVCWACQTNGLISIAYQVPRQAPAASSSSSASA